MNQTPQSRCSVLYIDDEEKALKYFRMALASKFSIHTASSGEEGLAILRKEAEKIGVVISDQRMPGMIGAEVLGVIREEFPHVVRILTTAFSDLDSAILAVNKGYIYQYVVKPWDVTELEMVLQRAADYYQILSERNHLLRLKMGTLQRILACDRVKWLLLAYGNGSGEPAKAFRRALLSLIRALANLPAPVQTEANVFRAEQFDALSLIDREFHTGVQVQAVLSNPDSGPSHSACEALSRLGERGSLPAASLGAFLAALPEGVSPSVDVEEDGVCVGLARPPAGFADFLAGVLFAREPGATSVLLLKALWRFSEAGIVLSLESGGTVPLRVSSLPETVSADEVVEGLREIFERRDINAL